ncbi:MAG: corrinoid protein [Desulfobacterales bacterium]|nr:corrinoid protein [Desulfobacterales bacterium]
MLIEISERLENGDAISVKKLTEKALENNHTPSDILYNGLVAGMDKISIKFKNNEIFIPEVLMAARAMRSGMDILKPLLAISDYKAKGKILIGTVKGDLHEIGKNIVCMMLEGAGYEVVNLGIDVTKESFLEKVKEHTPDIVAMSALLTTTMQYMKEVIDAIESENMRDNVKIIIGGAPVTKQFAHEIKADGYAADAASAVDIIGGLIA